MGIANTLYDALVSINISNDKAKAVIDAMEREMMEKLATKSDVAHLRELLSKDIHNQTNALTLRFLLTAAGFISAIIAVQKLF